MSSNLGTQLYSATMPAEHPLCPLTHGEISATSKIVGSAWPPRTEFSFKTITLQEPPKSEMVPYLTAEHDKLKLPLLERKAFVNYYIRGTNQFHETIVNLTTGKLERHVRLGPNVHGHLDNDEILIVEKITVEDEGVKAALAKLHLPENTVIIADPWPYGSNGIDDDEIMFQVYLYMRDPANSQETDSNHYAFPLPISPVVDAHTFKVVRIDVLPTGTSFEAEGLSPYQAIPPNEYLHKYNQPLNTELKPLNINQPEGPSFVVRQVGETGHYLDWQKWAFRIGYNQREGTVLYDVYYAGRPLFYRVSLSDLNIPYADPRPPFNKKASFDLGDAGAGAMANNLKLGCDCLGHIQYLSAVLSDSYGNPAVLENCVCIHEQDSGIGWKHTNYRTNVAAITRSRELVLQSIITVANYEYILAFIFNQAGEMTYEVRATGILSTQPIDQAIEGVDFGTVVHPGVLAAHHQHIFSLRIDPMLDGYTGNRVVYEEAYPMPLDPKTNPLGVGYYTQETIISESSGHDLDSTRNRVFMIQNPSVRNPVNKKAVAYKIQAPPFQKILAHPSSFHFKKAEFADHNIYVTAHRDSELFSGGWYTYQARGENGVRSWASRRDDVASADSDPVVWIQFGINHIARIEDFPVMPCEKLSVHLKPVNFFTKNPALDVPPSVQSFNKSTLILSELPEELAAQAAIEEKCCASPTGNASKL